MNTLEELALKWSVDKLHRHSYIPMYSKLFKPYRNKPVRLCEFGIGYRELMEPFVPEYHHGASLYMWKEYFFRGAQIHAADHHEHTLINDRKITSFLCDQSRYDELKLLREWLPVLDIFIDDGSHQLEHQILTASVMLNSMRPNSLYIIEDTYADKGQLLADMFGGELWRGTKTDDDNLVVIRI